MLVFTIFNILAGLKSYGIVKTLPIKSSNVSKPILSNKIAYHNLDTIYPIKGLLLGYYIQNIDTFMDKKNESPFNILLYMI